MGNQRFPKNSQSAIIYFPLAFGYGVFCSDLEEDDLIKRPPLPSDVQSYPVWSESRFFSDLFWAHSGLSGFSLAVVFIVIILMACMCTVPCVVLWAITNRISPGEEDELTSYAAASLWGLSNVWERKCAVFPFVSCGKVLGGGKYRLFFEMGQITIHMESIVEAPCT